MQKHIQMVLASSIHFFLLFSAFYAFQNIVSKVHSEEGDNTLGPFAIAINFSAFMIMNLFVSKFKGNREKWYITFSSLCYALFYITGFFIQDSPKWEKYLITAIGAAIGGFSSSFLWTNLGSYIHKVCVIFHKEEQKGHYFGIFNFFLSASTIVGAVIVTFGLNLFSHKVYFLIVSSVAFLSFLWGFFFIPNLPEPETHHQADQNISVWKTAKQTLKFYSVMRYSLGFIIFDGINLFVNSVIILRLLPDDIPEKQQNLYAGICLLVLGGGGIIGGYLGGKLCDIIKIKKTCLISMLFIVLACFSSIWGWYWKHMVFACISSFLWGLSQTATTSYLMVICSRFYDGRLQSFSIVKQLHSLVLVLGQIFTILTNNQIEVSYIMIGILLFTLVPFYSLTQLPNQDQSSLIQEEENPQIQSLITKFQ